MHVQLDAGAARLGAIVRGHLTRRLMHSDYVQHHVQSIRVCQARRLLVPPPQDLEAFVAKMHADYAGAAMPGDAQLLVQQARADTQRARAAIGAVFDDMVPAEQMRLLRTSKPAARSDGRATVTSTAAAPAARHCECNVALGSQQCSGAVRLSDATKKSLLRKKQYHQRVHGHASTTPRKRWGPAGPITPATLN